MLLSRRKLLLAAPALILPKRALAFGGGSSPDPYTLPRLPGAVDGWQATGGRTRVNPSSLSGSVGCIVVFGDSVPSNVVNSIYTPTQANNYNFNIYDGGLYKTVEPLLGCNWNAESPADVPSGSFFTRVADSLITNAVYPNVVLVMMGLGGSLLADYASGGSLNGRFAPVKARLDAAGLTATGIYCMLGANDGPNGTTGSSATTSMDSIVSTVRGIWPSTNMFVATHTLFDLTTYPAIQTAQQSVWSSSNKVYDGGDMDSLTSSSDYWDGTHPNATGAAAMASLAVTAISAHP